MNCSSDGPIWNHVQASEPRIADQRPKLNFITVAHMGCVHLGWHSTVLSGHMQARGRGEELSDSDRGCSAPGVIGCRCCYYLGGCCKVGVALTRRREAGKAAVGGDHGRTVSGIIAVKERSKMGDTTALSTPPDGSTRYGS